MTEVYPAGHELRSAQLKLARGKAHLLNLKRRIDRWTQANPSEAQVVKAEDIQRLLKSPPQPPDVFGVVLGDAVGCLRQSLDHIVWVLFRKIHPPGDLPQGIEKRMGWPFSSSLKHFNATNIKHIWPDAIDVIEAFQPYNRAKLPKVELLEWLDFFAQRDKHRIAAPTAPGLNLVIPVALLNAGSVIVIPPADDKHELVIAPPTYVPPNANQPIEPQIKSTVGFFYGATREDFLRTMRHVSDFSKTHDFIRDEVLPCFDRFFD